MTYYNEEGKCLVVDMEEVTNTYEVEEILSKYEDVTESYEDNKYWIYVDEETANSIEQEIEEIEEEE